MVYMPKECMALSISQQGRNTCFALSLYDEHIPNMNIQ